MRLPPSTDPKGGELGEAARHCKKAEAEWNCVGSVKVQHSESQRADRSLLHCIPSSAVSHTDVLHQFYLEAGVTLCTAAWVWSCLSCWALQESRNHTIHVKPTSAPSLRFPGYFSHFCVHRGGKDAPAASFWSFLSADNAEWGACGCSSRVPAWHKSTNLETSFGQ